MISEGFMSKIWSLVGRFKPALTLALIMALPLATVACATHTHIHG